MMRKHFVKFLPLPELRNEYFRDPGIYHIWKGYTIEEDQGTLIRVKPFIKPLCPPPGGCMTSPKKQTIVVENEEIFFNYSQNPNRTKASNVDFTQGKIACLKNTQSFKS